MRKRIPRCHFFGTELSRLARSHSQARIKARLGMGSDSPGQLCPEELQHGIILLSTHLFSPGPRSFLFLLTYCHLTSGLSVHSLIAIWRPVFLFLLTYCHLAPGLSVNSRIATWPPVFLFLLTYCHLAPGLSISTHLLPPGARSFCFCSLTERSG